MTTNDKPLSWNFDSDIAILKLESDFQHIRAQEIAFYNKVNSSVSMDKVWNIVMLFALPLKTMVTL